MHKERPLPIDVRMISIFLGDILTKDNRLFILKSRRHPLEQLFIGRFSLHVPGIQGAAITAYTLVAPIVGPVPGRNLSAPPFMTELMIHQPIVVLAADRRMPE